MIASVLLDMLGNCGVVLTIELRAGIPHSVNASISVYSWNTLVFQLGPTLADMPKENSEVSTSDAFRRGFTFYISYGNAHCYLFLEVA
ncbi:hypothetical protein ACJX0J_018190, partial [Zea mays]